MLGWEISVGSVGFFVCGVVRGHGLVLVGGERGRGRGGGGVSRWMWMRARLVLVDKNGYMQRVFWGRGWASLQ